LDIRFLAPGFFLLLLAVPLVWFWPARVRDVRHGMLRSAALILLVLGLVRPVLLTDEARPYCAFILDASASVSAPAVESSRAALRNMIEALPSGARTTVIELGAPAAGRATGPGDRPTVDSWVRLDASSLSAALAAGSRWIPEGSRGAITVLSDGASTDARWAAAVQDLSARGIPVHAVPLAGLAGDVRPVALRVPDRIRVGQTVQVACDVVGAGTVDAVLRGPNGELARVEGLAVRGRAAAVFEFEPDEAGFLRIEAEISAASDVEPSDNRIATTLAVQDPLRVFYLGDRIEGGGARLGDLLGNGFVLEGFELDAAAGVFADDGALARYDAVFVDDRPALGLPDAFQRQLVAAVQDEGLGLMVSGGKSAFGPGGYHGTPLADVLPTEPLQKEEKRDPSTTLVLIIDTSGSMGGMRVTLAKEVARLAMRRLLPHDKVGIVEFYGAKRWAAPIQPASNLIELQRALNRLDAGGGTVILPAIEEAFYGLQNVETRYKHVLILTDGGVETGAFEPLLRKMASKGVNISTVLVGGDAHSEFLVTLANWGKGRFYSVPNRFNLPEIILKQPATAQLPAYRPGEHLVRGRGGSGWWGAVDPTEAPPLAGYVETRARPGAQTLLETAAASHPILASWRFGLGRVTALMTEPTGPGTAGWRDWDGYGAWLARVVARTSRDENGPFAFRMERRDHELWITAEPLVAAPGWPEARLLEEDGSERAVEFRERAPGWFTSVVPWSPQSEARMLAGAALGSGRMLRLVSPAREDVVDELQVDPDRRLDLSELAAATGGSLIDAVDAGRPLATAGGQAPRSLLDLAPVALLLALLVFLGELLYRRFPLRQGLAT